MTTGVTIREPSSTPRAETPPAPLGKGKKKVSEQLAPIEEFSDENDMSFEDMFDRYSAPAAPSSKKKDSKRHHGESSKAPSTKKAQTGDPSAVAPSAAPSRETTPPLSPLDQTSPPAPVDQNPTPLAPAHQTRHDQPGDVLTSTVGMLTMTAGWRCTGTLVTKNKESDAKHNEEVKVLEGKNAELLGKNTELLEQNSKLAAKLQQYQTTLTKANEDKEKFRECAKLNFQEAKQLETELIASRKETEELEGRVKELEETTASNLERYRGATFHYFYEPWSAQPKREYTNSQSTNAAERPSGTNSMEADQKINRALNKIASGMLTMTADWCCMGALVSQTKESDAKHTEEVKFEDELIASRKETEELEGRVKELEETNASNLERYRGATFHCFYEFWKHNRGTNFNYLSERLRQTEIDRCTARPEEEERANILAFPEISLATGIEGAENEVGTTVDQENPEDPHAL
ncbi:uncharacterized protein LOC133815219 [Humulus lupulus]|uniref:uncharacterized protein LOC133815219 n=1 Tax=Humulus lupulus TaxID=3486 RepID=UPI002B41643C|nr:uncharacterized protein LOC133815219 [Humulus lupulus]